MVLSILEKKLMFGEGVYLMLELLDYILQVKYNGKWKDLSFIPDEYFKSKDDICFYVTDEQISKLADYKGKPIRLTKIVLVGNEVSHFIGKEFNSWTIYRNREVVCLDPNKNFREYNIEKSEILG